MQIRRTDGNGPPVNLAEGQLSVEMDTTPPRLWVGVPASLDASLRRLVNPGGVIVSDTVPVGPMPGDLWFNSLDLTLYVYYDDGSGVPSTQWVPVINQGLPDMSGFMPKSGGIFTGPIQLSANANQPLQPVSLQQLAAALEAIETIFAATAPPVGPAGQQWFNTSTGQFYLSNGTSWVLSTAPVTGFLPLTGGVLAGNLAITGDGVQGYLSIDSSTGYNYLRAGSSWIYSDANVFAIGLSGNPTLLNVEKLEYHRATGTIRYWNYVNQAVVVLDNGGNLTLGAGATCSLALYGGIRYQQHATVAMSLQFWGGNQCSLFADAANLGIIGLTPSDARIKSNVAPPEVDALTAINAITLYSFDRTLAETTRHYPLGVIAQEVGRHIPEAEIGPPDMKSVDLLPLTAYLIGAVQQLSERMARYEGSGS